MPCNLIGISLKNKSTDNHMQIIVFTGHKKDHKGNNSMKCFCVFTCMGFTCSIL